jgi:hypothetical protein
MANGAKIALAVGAGYFLGRTKKSRLALMLAAAGITGKFPSSPTDLVAHGVKSLGGSQQISGLTEQLRGELLNAAKAAALAAATSRVDALNDRLQGVASPAHASDLADQAGAPVRSLAGNRSIPTSEEDIYDVDEVDVDEEDEYPSDRDDDEPSDEDEDEYEDVDAMDEDDEAEPDEEPEPAPRPRRRASRQETAPKASTRRSARASSDTGSTRRRRSSTTTRRAPVRRGR